MKDNPLWRFLRSTLATSADYTDRHWLFRLAHSNLIAVLDEDGKVVHREEALGVDPSATMAAVRNLLDPAPPPR